MFNSGASWPAGLAMLAAAAIGCATAQAADPVVPKYGFGKPATPAEIAGWDIDVRPDGRGLPPGRGSVEQGQAIYDEKCASCHGTFGESNSYMQLAGGVGSLGSDQPVRSTASKLNQATTLWDYIRRAMPFAAPQTLTPDEVYALTAYVLNLDDIVPAGTVLDQDSLPRVKMPNRVGLTTAHGLMRRRRQARHRQRGLHARLRRLAAACVRNSCVRARVTRRPVAAASRDGRDRRHADTGGACRERQCATRYGSKRRRARAQAGLHGVSQRGFRAGRTVVSCGGCTLRGAGHCVIGRYPGGTGGEAQDRRKRRLGNRDDATAVASQ